MLYATYLFVYWVWDTANSQKNRFRQQERGGDFTRKTFPQLPWQVVKNPMIIETDTGDSLLVDGWCKLRHPQSEAHASPELTLGQMVTRARYIIRAICSSRFVGV